MGKTKNISTKDIVNATTATVGRNIQNHDWTEVGNSNSKTNGNEEDATKIIWHEFIDHVALVNVSLSQGGIIMK